jgi:IS5 family transposase
MAFKENLYDGDTLHPQLQQVQHLTGRLPQTGIVDRGYLGRKNILGVNILTPNPLGANASAYQKTKMRKRFRGRAGIESIIGHLKQDHRLSRNFLSGVLGDEINTLLAAVAFNMKKFLNRVKARIRNLLCQLFNFVLDLFNTIHFYIQIRNFQTC